MIKEKQFNLILRKPECPDEVIAQGSQKFVEDIRIKKILDSGVPADYLIIVEAQDTIEEESNQEINLGALLLGLGLTIIGTLIIKKYGKEK